MTADMTFDRRALILSAGLASAGLGMAAATAMAAGPKKKEAADSSQDAATSPGLVPNSGRNETAALQAAIDDAARRGVPLILPAGHFQSGPLVLRPGSRIIGAHGLTVIEYIGGGSLITADSADNIALTDIALDGGLLALDPAAATALVSLRACKNLVLDGLAVRRSLIDGIAVTGCSGRISNCTISYVSQTGLVSVDAVGLEIAHNAVSDCGNNGIRVWRSEPGEDGTIVTANRIERIEARAGGSGENGNGINAFRAGSVLVSGNRIADCAYSAIRGNAASNIQMIGNSCARLAEVALYAEFGFEGALIANNLVDGAASGIAVTNFNEGGRLAVVQGNIIRNLKRRESEPVDKRGEGISVEADAVVSGNVVEGAPTAGIVAGWGEYRRDISITGNLVRNAGVGILVSSDPAGGTCLIAQNLLSGAKEGAIRAMDHGLPVGPDLALRPSTNPRVSITGNIVA
jgi:uncharacterized secreted repeat protein (TIGR03808 family)